MIRCILFDRDGTLGGLGDDRYPETFTPYAPIAQTFAQLKRMGCKTGIISNQSSIARGTGAHYDFNAEFSSYCADVWKICPHDTADNCNCRKPKSGLLLAAADDLKLSVDEILVVGDRLSDILCAKNVGGEAALVLTGNGRESLAQVQALFPDLPVLNRFDETPSLLKSHYGYRL